jgi:hypothetical protein
MAEFFLFFEIDALIKCFSVCHSSINFCLARLLLAAKRATNLILLLDESVRGSLQTYEVKTEIFRKKDVL